MIRSKCESFLDFAEEHIGKFMVAFFLYMFISGALGTAIHIKANKSLIVELLMQATRLFAYVMEYGAGFWIITSLLSAFIIDLTSNENEYIMFKIMAGIVICLILAVIIYHVGKVVADNFLFLVVGGILIVMAGTASVAVIGTTGELLFSGAFMFTSIFSTMTGILVTAGLTLFAVSVIFDTIMSFF